MRLRGAVERLRVVDQVEVAVAQAELHRPACRPTCRGAAAATCPGTSGSSAKMVGSPVRVLPKAPSTPIRSPRSSSLGELPAAARRPASGRASPAPSPVSVPELQEMDLAHDPAEDDPAGGPDPLGRVCRRTIGQGRARMSAIGRWSSNRPPHGSRPRAAMRASFSARLNSWSVDSVDTAALSGWGVRGARSWCDGDCNGGAGCVNSKQKAHPPQAGWA